MIEPKFRVEMIPIDRTKKNGGSSTTFPIVGRVLETYRGSHIGQFWQGKDGEIHIAVFIRGGPSDQVVKADRLDPAIHEIWKEYFGSLSFWQRQARRLYSHRAWIAAFVVAVISSTIVLSAETLLRELGDPETDGLATSSLAVNSTETTGSHP